MRQRLTRSLRQPRLFQSRGVSTPKCERRAQFPFRIWGAFTPQRLSDQRGQSLIEFALTMVVLLLLLMGAFDLGRIYFSLVALNNAAGEGALYAAINPKCIQPSDGPTCGDPDNALYRARNESPTGLVDPNRMTIQAQLPPTFEEGNPIVITIHYQYDIVTPVISPFAPGGQLRLTAVAVQNIIDLKK